MKDWLHTFGHNVGVSKAYPDGIGITSSQESLVVSILSAGTFFGALAGAPVADILGKFLGT
jgi:SP family sugar:H+ symporter-like MFS transporter